MTQRYGASLIVVAAGAVAWLVGSNVDTPKEAHDRYLARHPDLASVLTWDNVENNCIVDAANRLRATRDDYAQSALMVCQAGRNVANKLNNPG